MFLKKKKKSRHHFSFRPHSSPCPQSSLRNLPVCGPISPHHANNLCGLVLIHRDLLQAGALWIMRPLNYWMSRKSKELIVKSSEALSASLAQVQSDRGDCENRRQEILGCQAGRQDNPLFHLSMGLTGWESNETLQSHCQRKWAAVVLTCWADATILEMQGKKRKSREEYGNSIRNFLKWK